MGLTWVWFTAALAAGEVRYPAQVFPAAGVNRIEISGVRGRVRVRGTATKAYRLRVAHAARKNEDWGLSVERRGGTLALEVFATALGREWKPLIAKDAWPSFDIEIEGPAVPLALGWRDGAVEIAGWPASVDASLLGGVFRLTGGRGLSLQLRSGDVALGDVRGPVRVRGGHGALNLREVRGAVDLDWFSGRVILDGVRGALRLAGERPEVRARDGEGAWRIDVPHGQVALAEFRGALTGRGVDSAWAVGVRGAVSAELKSRAGEIEAPFASRRQPSGARVARGTLGRAGSVERAQVSIETESGPVRLTY